MSKKPSTALKFGSPEWRAKYSKGSAKKVTAKEAGKKTVAKATPSKQQKAKPTAKKVSKNFNAGAFEQARRSYYKLGKGESTSA